MEKFYKIIFRFFSSTIVVGFMAVNLIAINEASATPITIDISDHGGGDFDQNYFEPDGVIFTVGSSVGFIQNDDALVFDESEGIAGLFTSAVTSISVQIAPWLQGTWDYRLAAVDGLSNIIDSKTISVTQDTGDSEDSGSGYFSIELLGLSDAVGFFIDSTFVRSSYGTFGDNAAALSSMSFASATAPVPEPTTMLLFGTGLIGLVVSKIRRKKMKN